MQRVQKNRLLIIAAFLLTLAACGKSEKVHTVSEFLHDAQLMNTTKSFCSENPSERMSTPNCENVKKAVSIKFKMSEFGHCYKGDSIDHACVDEYLEKHHLAGK